MDKKKKKPALKYPGAAYLWGNQQNEQETIFCMIFRYMIIPPTSSCEMIKKNNAEVDKQSSVETLKASILATLSKNQPLKMNQISKCVSTRGPTLLIIGIFFKQHFWIRRSNMSVCVLCVCTNAHAKCCSFHAKQSLIAADMSDAVCTPAHYIFSRLHSVQQ